MEDYTHLNLKRDLIAAEDTQCHEDSRTYSNEYPVQYIIRDFVAPDLSRAVDSEINTSLSSNSDNTGNINDARIDLKRDESELNNFHQTLIDIGWLLSILPKWHTGLNSSLVSPADIRNILSITGDNNDKDFEDILTITRIILRDEEKYNDCVFDKINSINNDIYEDMMRGLINQRYIMHYCRKLYRYYLNAKPLRSVYFDIQNRDIPEFDSFDEFIDIQ